MGYIYKISNSINDKVYIGQTLYSIEKRWQEHCYCSKKEKLQHRPLYSAMNKHGIENFHIELLEECDNNLLDEREKYWINYYNSYHKGYNSSVSTTIASCARNEFFSAYGYCWLYKDLFDKGVRKVR